MGLDLRTGRPVWIIGQAKAPGHRKLSRDIRTEVLVIGGGVSGALLAHGLIDRGMEVTLIDKREIAMGSTLASTAILSYEADVNLVELIGRIGERSAVRAYRMGIEAIDSIGEATETLHDSCDFRRCKSLYLASSLKDVKMMRRECECRHKHRFNVELLERRKLRELFSLDAPCAILNHDAAEVNPRKLTQALIRNALRNGLGVFSHTTATIYRRRGKRSFLITKDGYQIEARHVVFATGYETQQFLTQKTVRLLSSYAIASTAHTKFPKNFQRPVIWESARPYLYVRTTVHSRFVAGGEDVDFVDETKRDRLLPAKTKTLARKLRKMFPHVP